MSCNYISDTFVKKTQKDHYCEYCERTIPKGSPEIRLWKFAIDGEIENDYECHWCSENFMPTNDESTFADDIVEHFENNDTIPGNCWYAGSDGDYFIFKDRDTEKEVKRVYCPVIKKEVEE